MIKYKKLYNLDNKMSVEGESNVETPEKSVDGDLFDDVFGGEDDKVDITIKITPQH